MISTQIKGNHQNSQEPIRHLPQANQEVEDKREHDLRDQRNRDVHEREREALHERVVHRRAALPMHDRPLREQRRDLRHRRQRREQQREEQHAPTREERHRRVVQPEEHRADDDRLQDERRELDDLRGDPAADDLEAAEHERARLHRDRDDVNVATVTMYGLLERVWFARWSLKLDL